MPNPELPYDLGYSVIAVCMLLLAVHKTRAWLSERIPSLLLMAVAALASGSGFLTAAPYVYRAIDRTSGTPNLATLFVYGFITVSCAAFFLLVRLWSLHDPVAAAEERRGTELQRLRVAARLVAPAYAVVLILMAVFFLASGLPAGERPLTFDSSYATVPSVVAFLMVYQAGYGFALWSMAYLAWRYSRGVGDPVLRGSLRRTATGCVFVAFYGVLKIIAIVGIMCGVSSMAPVSNSVAPACASVGGVVIIDGWIYAARQVRRLRRREFRALEKLWKAVTSHEPGLVLRTRVPRSDWGLQLLAIRRAGEIRDGQLSLRPWLSERVVSEARRVAEAEDLRPSETEALAAAAGILWALRARQDNVFPDVTCASPPGIGVPPHAERRHLSLVGSYLDHPLVERILRTAT
ncbi:hypothetical protein K7472_25660 [Streptomyces sp. PTM05]|uniref:DUF6545 domain-containing protein n=1 Tax=Streptantibioticus parmotrematis TaxID=2873249 RepID=A0ABS7QZW0_9ACTN|nr:MAB_1171c family putative transporter [Streptantibioticus parmotrematis]MBY8888199.1 hypothetical protein [Streptantibioticus parmotrematis]